MTGVFSPCVARHLPKAKGGTPPAAYSGVLFAVCKAPSIFQIFFGGDYLSFLL
jgi:hypothetical protein